MPPELFLEAQNNIYEPFVLSNHCSPMEVHLSCRDLDLELALLSILHELPVPHLNHFYTLYNLLILNLSSEVLHLPLIILESAMYLL